MKVHTIYQRHGPSSSDKKILKKIPKILVNVNPGSSFKQKYDGPESKNATYQDSRQSAACSGE